MTIHLSYCSLTFLTFLIFNNKQSVTRGGKLHKKKKKFKTTEVTTSTHLPHIKISDFSKNSNENENSKEDDKVNLAANFHLRQKMKKGEDGKYGSKSINLEDGQEYAFDDILENYVHTDDEKDSDAELAYIDDIILQKSQEKNNNVPQNISNNEKSMPRFSSASLEDTENDDIYLQSFNVKKKKKNAQLNKEPLENSNIELGNKMKQQLTHKAKINLRNKTNLNPTLNFFASKALDNVLGSVQQQLQGPIPLDTNGNNSPLAMPIVTPTLQPNMNVIPNQVVPSTVNNASPPPMPPHPSMSQPSPPGSPPSPTSSQQQSSMPVPTPPFAQPNMPMRGGMPPNGPPNPMFMSSPMNSGSAPLGGISHNSAFNIHPTGVNMRDKTSNVTSSEIVSITIGIVLSLFFFCFISGCLIKMCKPKKKRRK